MAHVDVEIGNRVFRLTCEAGQEARIRELADEVGGRVRSAAVAGRVGSDAQMLLIAAIQIADELRDVLGGREELAARGLIASDRASVDDARVAEVARVIDDLTKRVETVVSRLDRA